MRIKMFYMLMGGLFFLLPCNFTLGQGKFTANPQMQSLEEYRVEPIAKMIELLSGQTTEIFAASTFWQLSSVIELPFYFTYLGQAHNQIKVSSNGFLTFDVSTTSHYLTNNLTEISTKWPNTLNSF